MNKGSCSAYCTSRSTEKGETLISLLVSVSLASVVFAAILSSFMNSTRHSFEHEIRIQTMEEANAILDLMAFDLRMLGSGLPLGQGGFAIGDASFGDLSLPVLTDATPTNITFRLNERGGTTMLTADFDPSSQASFPVYSATGFKSGDMIYLNNVSTGGVGGLAGRISGVAGNVITLGSGIAYTDSNTFRSGSLAAGVTELTYTSPEDGSGIMRDNGGGPVMVAPNSSFTLTYLDTNGGDMLLPLTSSSIATSLAGVRINVSVNGDHTFKNGVVFTARASQQVAFRNLNLIR